MEHSNMDNALSENTQTDTKKRAWSPTLERSTPNLKILLRPILFSLSISGCYNFNEISYERTGIKSRTSAIICMTYRIVILVGLLCHISIASSELFLKKGEQTAMLCMIVTWTLSLVITHLLLLKATSSKHGHLEKVFLFWEEMIVPEFEDLQIEFPTLKLRRRTNLVFVITWLVTALNVAASIAQFLITEPVLVLSPFGKSPSTILIYASLCVITSSVWTIPAAFVIMISKIVYETFSAYNKFLSTRCPKQDCKTADECQRVRLLHLNICKLVQEIDKDISWYYGCTFTFYIGLSVFMLYRIMEILTTEYDVMLFCFWMLSLIMFMALLSIYAAYVHDAAHTPLDTIYYINTQDSSVEKLTQLNLFLSKLTGTQIGFTASGLLVITKEFILSIVGAFLTYFAILYTL